MTDTGGERPAPPHQPEQSTRKRVAEGLARRYRRERRFRRLGLAALLFGLGFLAVFFVTLIVNGHSAFMQTRILLEITLDPEIIDPGGRRDPIELETANYQALIRAALSERFPNVTERREQRDLYALVSPAADLELRALVLAEPGVLGATRSFWLLADDDIDMLVKGNIDRAGPEAGRRLSDQQIDLTDHRALPSLGDWLGKLT